MTPSFPFKTQLTTHGRPCLGCCGLQAAQTSATINGESGRGRGALLFSCNTAQHCHPSGIHRCVDTASSKCYAFPRFADWFGVFGDSFEIKLLIGRITFRWFFQLLRIRIWTHPTKQNKPIPSKNKYLSRHEKWQHS